MSGSFGSMTYPAFYQMAGEFFKGCQDATLEQIENGHKALCIGYLALGDLTPVQEVSTNAILNLAGKRLLDAEIGATQ